MARLTERHYMTPAVYIERKTSTHNNTNFSEQYRNNTVDIIADSKAEYNLLSRLLNENAIAKQINREDKAFRKVNTFFC